MFLDLVIFLHICFNVYIISNSDISWLLSKLHGSTILELGRRPWHNTPQRLPQLLGASIEIRSHPTLITSPSTSECQKISVHANRRSSAGTLVRSATTLFGCQAACVDNLACVAYDFSYSQCYTHLLVTLKAVIVDSAPATGWTQYRVMRTNNCHRGEHCYGNGLLGSS